MIINTDEFISEILDQVRNELQLLVEDTLERYIANDEDAWSAIQTKVSDLIRESIISHDKDELWKEFLSLKNELKYGQSTLTLENKVEQLAKNMDALYHELQSLKRVD
jgi:hypothetical protein